MFPAALYDSVETYVVLKCVRTHDVIVVRIRNPHGYAAGLIDLTGNRLEFQGNFDVFGNDRFKNGKWKALVGAIGTGLLDRAALERRWIAHNRPLAGATLARPRKFESGRWLADFHLGNRNHCRGRLRECI